MSCWAAQPGVPLGYVGLGHATGSVDPWCDCGTYSPERDPWQLPLAVSVAAPYLGDHGSHRKAPIVAFAEGLEMGSQSLSALVLGLSAGRAVCLRDGSLCRRGAAAGNVETAGCGRCTFRFTWFPRVLKTVFV